MWEAVACVGSDIPSHFPKMRSALKRLSFLVLLVFFGITILMLLTTI